MEEVVWVVVKVVAVVVGVGWGGVGSPIILSIYKKGTYKNLQGDSSDFPKNPGIQLLS